MKRFALLHKKIVCIFLLTCFFVNFFFAKTTIDKTENSQSTNSQTEIANENSQNANENLQTQNTNSQNANENLQTQSTNSQTEIANKNSQNANENLQTETANKNSQNTNSQTETANKNSQTETANENSKKTNSQNANENLQTQNTNSQTQNTNLQTEIANENSQNENENLQTQNTNSQTEIANKNSQNANENLQTQSTNSQTETANENSKKTNLQTETSHEENIDEKKSAKKLKAKKNKSDEVQAEEKKATKTIITIEHAQTTVYEKNKETKAELIILEGDVSLSLQKDATTIKLNAGKVTFDRTTQMLYASESVTLSQTDSGSGGADMSAKSLVINTATLEGVFDDGRIVQTQSDALNLPAGSTLIVSSDMFAKSQSNTIAFKKGSLTFCDNENPHWHINATRIWLLPGGEFAFFNALLYVGVVPVMYLPFFYYPKDELIFNPVFSYDARRGYSIQTTTYLYGRKPLEKVDAKKKKDEKSDESGASESLKGLFNFIKPTVLKKQKREGLILHNLDEDFKGDTSHYFKIMADWYSNLGFLVGVDGAFRPNEYIPKLNTSLSLAFSTTAFDDGSGNFSPYDLHGNKYWDKSNFLGIKIPFRYALVFSFQLAKPFSLSLDMPIYSDPFFNDDFSKREETMDWISYMIESGQKNLEKRTVSEVSSFTWRLSSSYSLPSFSKLQPYVSAISFNLDSSVIFNSLQNVRENQYKPERKFYYPSQVTPANFSASFGGTIFEFPIREKTTTSTSEPLAFSLEEPDEFKTKNSSQSENKTETESANEKKSLEQKSPEELAEEQAEAEKQKLSKKTLEENALPLLQTETQSIADIPGFTYSLSYNAKPTVNSQIAYSAKKLNTPEDFKWKNILSSMYTVKVPISLQSAMHYAGDFFSMTNGISYEPVVQRHPFISTDRSAGGYTSDEKKSLHLADYKTSKHEIVNTNSIGVKPFYYIDMFKNTGVTYTSTIKLLRSEFIGENADNPNWRYYGPDFTNDKSVTKHELNFTYAMIEGRTGEFSQSLSLAMNLPPQVDEYTGTLSLTFPYTTFSLSTGFKKVSKTNSRWEKKNLQQGLSFSFFKNTLRISESYNYNLEKKHHESFRTSISWKGLEAAYTMAYTTTYDFVGRRWKQSEQEFVPYSFSLSYTNSGQSWYLWKGRIKIGLGLSTNITADLVRPTNSYFIFSPSINFEINEFLTFTFSSTSRNDVLYRYFQKFAGHPGRIPGETNMFIDLINSFRFDNEAKRKASGFKLKSLNFKITHDLHDWDLKTEFKISPRLVDRGGKKNYDFKPYVTISVVWHPLDAMKTHIVDDYGEWQLNP